MLIIKCPWCGNRDQIEFTYGGEAHIARPSNPEKLSDEEWADYLFFRKNSKGEHEEQWCHSGGCRKWFNTRRNTVSYHFDHFYSSEEDISGGSVK